MGRQARFRSYILLATFATQMLALPSGQAFWPKDYCVDKWKKLSTVPANLRVGFGDVSKKVNNPDASLGGKTAAVFFRDAVPRERKWLFFTRGPNEKRFSSDLYGNIIDLAGFHLMKRKNLELRPIFKFLLTSAMATGVGFHAIQISSWFVEKGIWLENTAIDWYEYPKHISMISEAIPRDFRLGFARDDVSKLELKLEKWQAYFRELKKQEVWFLTHDTSGAEKWKKNSGDTLKAAAEIKNLKKQIELAYLASWNKMEALQSYYKMRNPFRPPPKNPTFEGEMRFFQKNPEVAKLFRGVATFVLDGVDPTKLEGYYVPESAKGPLKDETVIKVMEVYHRVYRLQMYLDLLSHYGPDVLPPEIAPDSFNAKEYAALMIDPVIKELMASVLRGELSSKDLEYYSQQVVLYRGIIDMNDIIGIKQYRAIGTVPVFEDGEALIGEDGNPVLNTIYSNQFVTIQDYLTQMDIEVNETKELRKKHGRDPLTIWKPSDSHLPSIL